MTMQEQLATSTDSVRLRSLPSSLSLLTNMGETGQLGNASAQIVHFSSMDVPNFIETYHKILHGAQPSFRLALLKRRTLTAETRQARIDKSLAALRAAQPTNLPVALWKSILEEIEDED